jgi:hypothetical protein
MLGAVLLMQALLMLRQEPKLTFLCVCVVTASGNTNQPFSLNFDRTTTNVTGGSTAAAPSIDSAVQQILNPKVNYSSGGRRLA